MNKEEMANEIKALKKEVSELKKEAEKNREKFDLLSIIFDNTTEFIVDDVDRIRAENDSYMDHADGERDELHNADENIVQQLKENYGIVLYPFIKSE